MGFVHMLLHKILEKVLILVLTGRGKVFKYLWLLLL